ncbi:hypothetical protein MWH28_12230 [Natroniella sulfidigena]|uniref:hypothetical protein n=1 Tax=Natroniella sulfidigena TaxID=723921 RepID=UPI00200AB25F|nr:hypothetical protein [Natroniella sulfidigena]MCK8818124.1 hypothetical protein [Natroniella sulfidigena]
MSRGSGSNELVEGFNIKEDLQEKGVTGDRLESSVKIIKVYFRMGQKEREFCFKLLEYMLESGWRPSKQFTRKVLGSDLNCLVDDVS